MRSLIILVIVCYGKCGGLLVGRGMSDMTGLAAEGTMVCYQCSCILVNYINNKQILN